MANTLQARGSFTVDQQTHTPVEWQGGAMTHTNFKKTFSGDLVGTSVVEAVMLRTEGDGPAAYAGLERVDCTLGGQAGTFLLLHSATMRGSEQNASWTIVPGSGTDGLRGIGGKLEIGAEHAYVLDYDIGA